jgi:hypothetical protein
MSRAHCPLKHTSPYCRCHSMDGTLIITLTWSGQGGLYRYLCKHRAPPETSKARGPIETASSIQLPCRGQNLQKWGARESLAAAPGFVARSDNFHPHILTQYTRAMPKKPTLQRAQSPEKSVVALPQCPQRPVLNPHQKTREKATIPSLDQ